MLEPPEEHLIDEYRLNLIFDEACDIACPKFAGVPALGEEPNDLVLCFESDILLRELGADSSIAFLTMRSMTSMADC